MSAAGADFRVLAAARTMVPSSKPVIAVCAVRTGCGKSQTSRRVTEILKEMGKTVAVVRHQMPYGDLTKQICQRFASYEDLDKHECTIEEREEYEPHLAQGNLVFAGVDYERILRAAEKEADVIRAYFLCEDFVGDEADLKTERTNRRKKWLKREDTTAHYAAITATRNAKKAMLSSDSEEAVDMLDEIDDGDD